MLTARGFDTPDALRLSEQYDPDLVRAVCAYAERGSLGPGWIVNRLRSGELPPAAPAIRSDLDPNRFRRWLDQHVPEHAGRPFAFRVIYRCEERLRKGDMTGPEVVRKIRDLAAEEDGGEQLSLLARYPRPVDGTR